MKEKFIENGIEYVRNGDYYIPNQKAPGGTYNIGKYRNNNIGENNFRLIYDIIVN